MTAFEKSKNQNLEELDSFGALEFSLQSGIIEILAHKSIPTFRDMEYFVVLHMLDEKGLDVFLLWHAFSSDFTSENKIIGEAYKYVKNSLDQNTKMFNNIIEMRNYAKRLKQLPEENFANEFPIELIDEAYCTHVGIFKFNMGKENLDFSSIT